MVTCGCLAEADAFAGAASVTHCFYAIKSQSKEPNNMTEEPNPDWRTDEQRAGWQRFVEWLLGKDHPALKETKHD